MGGNLTCETDRSLKKWSDTGGGRKWERPQMGGSTVPKSGIQYITSLKIVTPEPV